jgi:hypothetical protein
MARLDVATDVTLSELTLELFYPADEATEKWLRSETCQYAPRQYKINSPATLAHKLRRA